MAGPPTLILWDLGQVLGADTILGLWVDRDLFEIDQFEPFLHLRVLDKGSAVHIRVFARRHGLVGSAAGGHAMLLQILGTVGQNGREGEDQSE